MTTEKEKIQLQVFVCQPKCDAGGPPHRGGHDFTEEWESEDGLASGYRCKKCKMSNMDFDMWMGE